MQPEDPLLVRPEDTRPAPAASKPLPGQWLMAIMAFCVVFGFFGVLGLLLFGHGPDGASTTISIMVGTLNALVSGIIGYYYGSSQGSARKTEILEEGKNAPPPG